MRRFVIEQPNTEHYTSHSGLVLVGLCVNQFTDLDKRLAAAIPLRNGIAHGDLVKSYLGQPCLGKSDFKAGTMCATTDSSSTRWASGGCRRRSGCASASMPSRGDR